MLPAMPDAEKKEGKNLAANKKIPINTILANRNNYGGPRPVSSIQYIVLHYTANDGDNALSNARYFQTAHKPAASAHYFADDDRIVQSVPDNYTAWAVGGKKYTDTAATGGGSLYGIVTNANSISIEMCDTKKDGSSNATEATLANAAALCRRLMSRYGIDIGHVVRHFDVTGKHCPVFLMNDADWNRFKTRLNKNRFPVNRTYAVTRSCYLRTSPQAVSTNRARYSALSDAVKKKCRQKLGNAVFQKGKVFRLMRVASTGADVWGQMKSGYWVPLVRKGKLRVK